MKVQERKEQNDQLITVKPRRPFPLKLLHTVTVPETYLEHSGTSTFSSQMFHCVLNTPLSSVSLFFTPAALHKCGVIRIAHFFLNTKTVNENVVSRIEERKRCQPYRDKVIPNLLKYFGLNYASKIGNIKFLHYFAQFFGVVVLPLSMVI